MIFMQPLILLMLLRFAMLVAELFVHPQLFFIQHMEFCCCFDFWYYFKSSWVSCFFYQPFEHFSLQIKIIPLNICSLVYCHQYLILIILLCFF